MRYLHHAADALSPPFYRLHGEFLGFTEIPGIYSQQEFLGFIPNKNFWDLFPTEIPGIYSQQEFLGFIRGFPVRHFPTQKIPCVCQ